MRDVFWLGPPAPKVLEAKHNVLKRRGAMVKIELGWPSRRTNAGLVGGLTPNVCLQLAHAGRPRLGWQREADADARQQLYGCTRGLFAVFRSAQPSLCVTLSLCYSATMWQHKERRCVRPYNRAAVAVP